MFTRYPEPGQAKTRLIPSLGAIGAAELQRRMTERLTAHARRLAERTPLTVEVRFQGARLRRMQQWLGRWPRYAPQGQGDLGREMSRALTEALHDGANAAVLVGSDCPSVDARLLGRAFRALKHRDLVLGPAADGGYYLVGVRRPAPELFTGIEWGRADVLERTLGSARRLGLSYGLLDVLPDVDRPEDLARLSGCSALLVGPLPSARISVIVPALNEEKSIAPTLSALSSGRNVEVILVDGGSTDRTRQIARSHGARVVEGPARRAKQANMGARAARGEILFFLHADTLVPPGYDTHIRTALRAGDVVAGAFDLAIDGEGPGLRFIEQTVALRSRWRQLPYGDQGLFLYGATFRRLGPFPDMPIMEDYVFVRRLAGRGRIVTVPVPVLTSARRWQRLGVARTTFVNSAVVAAFRLGVAPERLAGWYRGVGAGSRGATK